MTTNKQTTYSVPPTTILHESDTALALPQWEFTPQSLQGADFQVAPTWTWYVPREAYPSGGTGNGDIFFFNLVSVGGVDLNNQPLCYVPFPFSTWTVDPPQLSSLDPTSTEIDGGQFTITGQFLYPGSVTAVLIGGTAIPLSTNVGLVDDTTIEVTVGGVNLPPGTYPVQVNTQFNGTDRFSNQLSLTLALILTGD